MGPEGPHCPPIFSVFPSPYLQLCSAIKFKKKKKKTLKNCAKMCLAFSVAWVQLSVDMWTYHLGNSQLPVADGVSLVQEKTHSWVAWTDALQSISGCVFHVGWCPTFLYLPCRDDQIPTTLYFLASLEPSVPLNPMHVEQCPHLCNVKMTVSLDTELSAAMNVNSGIEKHRLYRLRKHLH